MKRIKVHLTVLDGDGMKVGVIVGKPRPVEGLLVEDVTTHLAEAESYLSRLLAMTVKIETETM